MDSGRNKVNYEKAFLRRHGPKALVRLDHFWREECVVNYPPHSRIWRAHLRLVDSVHDLAGAITGDRDFLVHRSEWSAVWRDRHLPCAEFSRAWWLRELEAAREKELADAC